MLCSGCGKEIPFQGEVCPYCMRDKSKDQAYVIVAMVFGVIGGVIGYFVFDILGAVGGFFLGCIVAAFVTLGGGTKPPQVRMAATASAADASDSLAGRLAQLKDLHEQGLITHDEFAAKKAELLQKL